MKSMVRVGRNVVGGMSMSDKHFCITRNQRDGLFRRLNTLKHLDACLDALNVDSDKDVLEVAEGDEIVCESIEHAIEIVDDEITKMFGNAKWWYLFRDDNGCIDLKYVDKFLDKCMENL